jgi:hypothetical protein
VFNGDGDDVRHAWASTYLRQAPWNDPWITYGYGLPDEAQVIRVPIEAVDGPGWLGQLESRSNIIDSVVGSAGEIVVVQTSGLASAHDEAGNSELAFTKHRFCVSGDCVCPPKTQHEGEHMADSDIQMPFVLAFNAPEGGSTYSVVGKTLEEECGPQQSEPPPPAGGDTCGSGCAGSNGDPHMVTVNGAYYDFQAVGEYTLLRSADGTIEIQARQEPYEDSASVAINTAIAARVAGHRVGVYSNDGNLTVRVDGQPADASRPIDLGNGAQVSQHQRGVEIQAQDGTQVWALSSGGYGITVQVRPSDGLRREGVGILGRVLPGGLGVPALPDGTRLARAANADQRYQSIYGTLGPAWRVTDANTLFDYDSGKSTASYNQPGFPSRPRTSPSST